MAKTRYLIDSVILIDHLNGVLKSTQWLSGVRYEEAVISPVTRAEVLVGAGEAEETAKRLIDSYDCLPIDAEIATLAARLRGQWKIRLPDAFQLALAERHKLILVTRDKGDFGKILSPAVRIPYSL